ncbi:Chemotaxis protein PomA [Thalassocella blandensis]|nr:Chemotaxis protein PomA [Thalassocella blandensis]
MNGLDKKYLTPSKRIFDPISVFVSIALIVGVLAAVIGTGADEQLQNPLLFSDFRSFFFVIGGTFGCLLFQFDFITLIQTFVLSFKSFIFNPTKDTTKIIDELDEAIITGASILNLREGNEITGELLNDIVHMVKEKLFYEEIDALIANRIATTFLTRKAAVDLLNKGTKIAPALGLLGTVIGLIEVLQSLEDPSKIGPAMSLALMTTAFGSILGSFIFTPLAGRLEHQNVLYLETHKLLMNRVNVLLQREERRINPATANKKLEGASES